MMHNTATQTGLEKLIENENRSCLKIIFKKDLRNTRDSISSFPPLFFLLLFSLFLSGLQRYTSAGAFCVGLGRSQSRSTVT